MEAHLVDGAVNDLFRVGEPLLLRMSAAPRVATPNDQPVDIRSRVRGLVADPLLREAIMLASGSLSGYLDGLEVGAERSEKDEKKLNRAALSVTRYQLRLGGRATPFGLFAGVSAAELGLRARAVVRGPGEKSVRLDAEWLHDRIQSWLGHRVVRRHVHVVVNDLCFGRDDRLVIRRGDQEVSVRRTSMVAWICANAAQPTPYPRLLSKAVQRFPDHPENRLDDLLAQLIQHGFLLTSITPRPTDPDLLDRVASAVHEIPEAAAELRRVRTAADAYRAAPAGDGIAAWRRLLATVDPERALPRPPAQVDLRMDASIVLPTAVADEACGYASAMWTISPAGWVAHPHIRGYRARFVERYGTGSAVPLAELVDPHRGLGFPEGYGEPQNPTTDTSESPRHRRSVIAELVQEAMLSDDRQIALTRDDIARLSIEHDADDGPPRSVELCFQLLADSLAALDAGDFRLLNAGHPGSWQAGATIGRFADLTGTTPQLSRLLGGGIDELAIVAQVSFQPRTRRALNLVQMPRLLPYEIPVGVYADRADAGYLDWRDLAVTVDPHGFRLVRDEDGRQVIPVVPHMLALDKEAPPLVRLLVDLSLARPKMWTGWDWAGLETLPALPRVSFGRVVVAARRWRPDRRLREATKTAADERRWEAALTQWRERYEVPDRVQIAQRDRRYGVDLQDPWHRRLLRHDLTRGRLYLLEDLTADGRGLGWAGGHSTEVVVPLTRHVTGAATGETSRQAGDGPTGHRPTVRLRPRDVARSRRHSYLPGEEWIYAKLYAVPEIHEPLLRDHLPGLLHDVNGSVDRWFFIRYRDPEPHIRVRLHGDPETLCGKVLPEMARHGRLLWRSGVIRTMILDAYEPEVDRYGGPAAIELAERLFCLDSRSVIAQLGLRAQRRLNVPDEVLVAFNQAILLDALGSWDWGGWLEGAFQKFTDHAAFGRHRSLVIKLIHPGETLQRVTEHFSCPELTRLWDGAPEPRAYGAILLDDQRAQPRTPTHGDAVLALLHMQHNRLIGVDRASEHAGAALLRGVARAHLGRLRHGGGDG